MEETCIDALLVTDAGVEVNVRQEVAAPCLGAAGADLFRGVVGDTSHNQPLQVRATTAAISRFRVDARSPHKRELLARPPPSQDRDTESQHKVFLLASNRLALRRQHTMSIPSLIVTELARQSSATNCHLHSADLDDKSMGPRAIDEHRSEREATTKMVCSNITRHQTGADY